MRTFSFKTKTNLRRSSHSARELVAALALAACGILTLVFFRSGASTAASLIFSPVVAMKTRFMESSTTAALYLRTQYALVAEVQSLERELRARDGDASVIAGLRAENNALAEVLKAKKDADIVASVIAWPSQTPYDTFLIDRGSADGVVEGAIVSVASGIAAGTIVRTYAHSALARLASSPGVRSTAYIFGANIFVEAEGMGGGVLRLAVPQGVPLAVGDAVALPAASTGIYGQVASVDAPESSPEQYGYVTLPVPLSSVRLVGIARSAAPVISYEQALETVRSASSTLFSVSIPTAVLVGTSTAETTPPGEE